MIQCFLRSIFIGRVDPSLIKIMIKNLILRKIIATAFGGVCRQRDCSIKESDCIGMIESAQLSPINYDMLH